MGPADLVGNAATIAEAEALAASKLAKWRQFAEAPVLSMDDGKVRVVKMPQRPRTEAVVLYEALDTEAAQRYIASLKG